MIQTNSFNVRNLSLKCCPTSIKISFTRLWETIFLLNWIETGRYVELSVRNVTQPSYKVISFRENIGRPNGEHGYRGNSSDRIGHQSLLVTIYFTCHVETLASISNLVKRNICVGDTRPLWNCIYAHGNPPTGDPPIAHQLERSRRFSECSIKVHTWKWDLCLAMVLFYEETFAYSNFQGSLISISSIINLVWSKCW